MNLGLSARAAAHVNRGSDGFLSAVFLKEFLPFSRPRAAAETPMLRNSWAISAQSLGVIARLFHC